mgnify:CR=1 FL=1
MTGYKGMGMRAQLFKLFEGPGITPNPETTTNIWPAPTLNNKQGSLQSAAVLVLLIDHPNGMTILLTQRAETLPKHAGQIAFPGGGQENGDASPEDTALRETREEVGLSAESITLLGRMNAHETGTGYRVMPIVGIASPPLTLSLNYSEVIKIFELPIEFILDKKNIRLETKVQQSKKQKFYVLSYKNYYIWGLTARILVELSYLMRRE